MQSLIQRWALWFAVAGVLVFGAVLALSWGAPTTLERTAQTMIRARMEQTVHDKIAALDAPFLQGKLRHLLQDNATQLAQAREALARGLPAKVAEVAARMGVPECTCRQQYESRLEEKIRSLTQLQTQLEALLRNAYLDTAEKLLRELRIFCTINLIAFALLGLAAGRAPTASQAGPSHAAIRALLPATATLLLATVVSSGMYLWGQNWLHTTLFHTYAGWAQAGYVGVTYLWLCDLFFNRARVSQFVANAVGSIGTHALPAC